MRSGFEYMDLNRQKIVGTFRPHPASNPLEVYVAIHRGNTPTLEIYRLITRERPSGGREFVKNERDGKNLVVQVKKGDIVDSMRKYYRGGR